MINLTPTKKEVQNSSEFARKYDEGEYGKNVLNVSHEEFIEFIRIGKLCELVFTRFLRNEDISINTKGILEPHEGDFRQDPDFILNHSNQSGDVKAAHKSFHTRLLVREDQFKAHVHDIYIGTKYIDDTNIEVHGYTTGDDLKKVNPRDFGNGPCRHIKLNDLTSIEQFIKYCKNGKKVV